MGHHMLDRRSFLIISSSAVVAFGARAKADSLGAPRSNSAPSRRPAGEVVEIPFVIEGWGGQAPRSDSQNVVRIRINASWRAAWR